MNKQYIVSGTLLTEIADAARSVDGSTEKIKLKNIPQKIKSSLSASFSSDLISTSTDTSGNAYGTNGLIFDTRLNSSGAEVAATGSCMSGYFWLNANDTIIIYNNDSSQKSMTYLWGYNSDYSLNKLAYSNLSIAPNSYIFLTILTNGYYRYSGTILDVEIKTVSLSESSGNQFLSDVNVSCEGSGTSYNIRYHTIQNNEIVQLSNTGNIADGTKSYKILKGSTIYISYSGQTGTNVLSYENMENITSSYYTITNSTASITGGYRGVAEPQ